MLTIIFLLATVTLQPFAIYSDAEQEVIVLVALLVCLIPTTIGALLSAIGIAGMDRLVQHNVLAMSGRAVEAAGDCSTLLLDKTGTVTLGNRQAAFLALPGIEEERLPRRPSWPVSPTRPRRADRSSSWPRSATTSEARRGQGLPGPVHRRALMGINLNGQTVRKGAADAVKRWVSEQGGTIDQPGPAGRRCRRRRRDSAGDRRGGGPQVCILGVIHLKDVVKEGMRTRFEQLRAMGIRTVMITSDNPLTARYLDRSRRRRLPCRGPPRGQDRPDPPR